MTAKDGIDSKTHYDLLVDENNDSFRDPPVLQKYMESWDGQVFLDLMELDQSKTVLEIGVGIMMKTNKSQLDEKIMHR